ncbi:hypothetical protein SDRG_13278 [Saprolegnia diclina VS20]|uniref:VPS9 domain-containing protein n=1 Tax=Saprolegnia diclina (strain VS20) TaxID=1156394 RepID=T0PTW9_SAPDV|nr:hypothetical protein SDRG_13278 [Saprolegnia diclina VS20]EQC28939.1 hypothetical protein SDRG_13278 [Saprolegnia diclina VS20]|eukprot:XP_008617578.1 hypothetical protein SDRG_13278 [Saprolegnia diclina VS20]
MAENAVGNDAIMRLCKVVCEDDSSYRSNQDDEPPVDDAHEALAKEVYLLRKERDDLQGALKARDMELTALRERYELLLTAVEQQDEAIAAIYATTGAPNATQALEQYSAIRESCLLLTAQKKMGRTAHEMLQAHLDSMGFEGLDVAPVVAALQEQNPGSSGRHDLALLNSALDQLLYAPSNNNFDGSATTPEASSLSHLAATGFLRRKSGRLSVSDFGLLETSSPRRDSDPLFTDDEEDHTAPTAEAQGEPVEELTYNGFLERLSLPGSRDLVDHIRRFLGSILGPRGDGQPPTSSHFVDYPFCGNTNFQARCEGFFRGMDELLAKHPAWRHAPESTLVAARDGIEKYVMDKLADIPLTQLPRSREWRQEDAVLWRRMQLLSFVTPDMLDIKPCMRNEVVWSIATDELRRMNAVRSPGDKIHCIVRCCSIIFSVLNLSRGDDALNRPGADDFLPVFIYIVLHSQIPGLYSNAEYIAAYRHPADLMSKAGYCFVNLRSAIEFILVLDASMLTIAPDEFDRLLADADAALPPNSDAETTS